MFIFSTCISNANDHRIDTIFTDDAFPVGDVTLVFAHVHDFLCMLVPKTLRGTIIEITFAILFDPADVDRFFTEDIPVIVKDIFIMIDDMFSCCHFTIIEDVVLAINPLLTGYFPIREEVVPVLANFHPFIFCVATIGFKIVGRTVFLIVNHLVFRNFSICFEIVIANPFSLSHLAVIFEEVPFLI